jgi:hypothetical protein
MRLLTLSLTAQPLTTLDYVVTGQVMEVTPSSLSVPKGLAGSVGISIPGEVPSGAFVEAVLRGPSFAARRLVGAPNAPLMLPPLSLAGDYSLDAIRLVSVSGETLLEGTPNSVPVTVFDEVLVSRVTSWSLTLSEIEERGIEIDKLNFRAVEFEVAFVVDGKSFPVKFAVIAPNFRQNTEIIPAAELINQQLSETVGLPAGLEAVMPQFQVKGINMQFGAGGGDGDLALSIPPIPALTTVSGLDAHVGFSLLIDIPAVAYGDHENGQLSILDLAKDPVVCHPVSPESGEVSLQSLAEISGIIRFGDPLVQIGDDLPPRIGSEFAEFLERAFVNLPGPGHVSPPLLKMCGRALRASFQPDRYPQGRPDVRGWLPEHRKSWCAPCAWRAIPGVFRFLNSNELQA